MNTKRQATAILILILSLVILGCASGQLLKPTPTPRPILTPTFDPSMCPKGYLQKFLAAAGGDVSTDITTELAEDGSVNAYTLANNGGVMLFANLNVYDHKLTSADLPQVADNARLDAQQVGDGSIAFLTGPIMNVGGNITRVVFFRGNVLSTVSGQDLVNLQNIPVGTIWQLAQVIDQALPPAGIPRQLNCTLVAFAKPTTTPTAMSLPTATFSPTAIPTETGSPISIQLEVIHYPNPAKFQSGGVSGKAYTCAYKTSVKAIGAGVRIEKFGMYFWENNEWVHSTSNNGQPWSSQDFADWYSCPGAYVGSGQECSDPNNWSGADTSILSKGKWYYAGVDDNGNEVQGEAVIECQP